MKVIFYFFIIFFFNLSYSFAKNPASHKNYECISDTSVSGLFQNKKKFLKETEFFPNKTIFNFTKDFSLLTEKENNDTQVYEAKYQFNCLKNEKKSILSCHPIGSINSYDIKFSLSTMRYRKALITDYWLNGVGNEVDYVHIAHGYCYNID